MSKIATTSRNPTHIRSMNSEPNLPWIVWLTPVVIDLAWNAHRPVSAALNPDRSVIIACYEGEDDASAQSDAVHHRAVEWLDSCRVRVERQRDGCLRPLVANAPKTNHHEKKRIIKDMKISWQTSFSVIANVCICRMRFRIMSISVDDDEGDNEWWLVTLRRCKIDWGDVDGNW